MGQRKQRPEPAPYVLDEKAAGKFLGGVHPVALAKWRAEGRGPAFVRTRDARKIFYRVEDLRAWIDRDVVVPTKNQVPLPDVRTGAAP